MVLALLEREDEQAIKDKLVQALQPALVALARARPPCPRTFLATYLLEHTRSSSVRPAQSSLSRLTAREAAADHMARCASLGITRAASLLPETVVPPRQGQTLRIMSWNVLAAGLSDDGFHLRSVLDAVDGGSSCDMDADYVSLLAQLQDARGDVDALKQLQTRFSSGRVVTNHRAVLDQQRRWCRFRELIALHRPDVIIFQEMDTIRTAIEALAPLGYVCSGSGAAAARTAEQRDSEVPDLGDLQAEADAYLAHVRRAGLAFAPKVGSVCRKLAKAKRLCPSLEPDDDGVAILWLDETFELTRLDFRCLRDPKQECRLKGTVGVQLRRRSDGCPVALLTAHLTSGTDDRSEQMRLAEVNEPSALGRGRTGPSLLEAFAASARQMATVLALDANSGPDRATPSLWRAMRSAPGVSGSVWDMHWSSEGEAHSTGSCIVTSNKMRGPLSAQPNKIGEHIFQCCDLVFFSDGLSMQRHVFEPLSYADANAGKLALLPTLALPSDHAPVCVDLMLQPSSSAGGSST